MADLSGDFAVLLCDSHFKLSSFAQY